MYHSLLQASERQANYLLQQLQPPPLGVASQVVSPPRTTGAEDVDGLEALSLQLFPPHFPTPDTGVLTPLANADSFGSVPHLARLVQKALSSVPQPTVRSRADQRQVANQSEPGSPANSLPAPSTPRWLRVVAHMRQRLLHRCRLPHQRRALPSPQKLVHLPGASSRSLSSQPHAVGRRSRHLQKESAVRRAKRTTATSRGGAANVVVVPLLALPDCCGGVGEGVDEYLMGEEEVRLWQRQQYGAEPVSTKPSVFSLLYRSSSSDTHLPHNGP